MTSRDIGAWLMVFFGGLWAGGILIVAVERTNLWRRMPVEQFAVDFRRSLLRVDPMMPVLGVISLVGSVLFGFESSGDAETLAWIATALTSVVIGASLVIAEPMNSRFRRLSEGQVPEGAEQLRTTWRRFHAGRTVLALASFGCLATAAVS